MFIYYFAHIPQPFPQLAGHFEDHPDLWLPWCVSKACNEDESIGTDGGLGACSTTVAVGPVGHGEGSAAVSIRVESGVPGIPFTHLEADLEIADLGPSRTQLTLRGSYRGPLRSTAPAYGLRHRWAEALAKAIVEQVSDHLTAPADVAQGTSRR